MKRTTAVPSATRCFAALLALALIVAGCAPVEEEVGQCEPGVEGLSRMSDVTPPGC